jgi:hypothetical protein
MSVRIIQERGQPVVAVAIGSVTDTLAGRIDDALRVRRFPASDYLCGFEGASPKGVESIGESVLVNGKCYATSTEAGVPEHGQVIHGPEFITGGYFLLPKDAQPSHQLSAQDVTFEHLCKAMYDKVQRPVAFMGMCECSSLQCMVCDKPPIDGRPIFANRDYYFPTPHQIFHEKRCFVMGIMTNYGDERWTALNEQLEVVLYNNPDDRQVVLTSHTHGLVLRQDVQNVADIDPSTVEKCVHIFNDKTTLTKAALSLVTIENLSRPA